MERDEVGTMALLRARRHDVLLPSVARHGGRIFKVMGDGVLIEFTSVVNAVECAIDLQDAMKAQNADLPADQHILLRIGINLGDVIVEGSDLYGDGVNLAAQGRSGSVRIRRFHRASSGAVKGQAIDVKEVGRKLGARHVLEGSVRRVGNRVRITAQLVETAAGNHLWAERYDRDL